jgi:hypothetical protein
MESPKDISRLSPDRLMKRFRDSKIVACLLVALALHVVVLGATSVSYIHGLVDPAWKQQQDELAEAARKAKAAKPAEKGPASTQPATAPAGKARPAPAPASPAAPDRKLPPELTTMPKPGEIPEAPKSGLGIDDMNK